MNWRMVIWLVALALLALALAACATPAPLTVCEEYNLRVMRGGELSEAEADHLLATCDWIVVPI